ncbi:MAG: DegT/DnrJ/EryC1/StrS family aminotransferase [Candidatus Thiodiazotropha endolucinida]
MFYKHTPVGNRIRYVASDGEYLTGQLQQLFDPYKSIFYDSGTSALAAALVAAKRSKQCRQPEVILPAYGCPDLLSAAVFAGVKPILVDLEQDRPWMQIEEIKRKANRDTVAIVCVNFLGIPERVEQIRRVAAPVNAFVIEDSAQYFPHTRDHDSWKGDLIVLSLGRGKPVNLLGGGILLARDDAIETRLPKLEKAMDSAKSKDFRYRLKVLLYNRIISPRLYWILLKVPLLDIGSTVYKPLAHIEPLSSATKSLLASNIELYRSDRLDTQKNISSILDGLRIDQDKLDDLPRSCDLDKGCKLLRYPLLIAQRERDNLLQGLEEKGLGPSVMYPTTLNRIPNIDYLFAKDSETYPHATNFSKRIITLPTHNRITQRDFKQVKLLLSSLS